MVSWPWSGSSIAAIVPGFDGVISVTNGFAIRQPENIKYLRIRKCPRPEGAESYIDSILSELITAKRIVLDIRANPGGNGFGSESITNRFSAI